MLILFGFPPLVISIIVIYAFLYALLMRNRMLSLKYVILFNSALVLYYLIFSFLGFTNSFTQFFTEVLPYVYFIGLFIFLLAQYFLILFAKRKKETKQWFLAFGLAIASVILLYGIYGATSYVLWFAKTIPCSHFEETPLTVKAPAYKENVKYPSDYPWDRVVVTILDQRCLREDDSQIYFTLQITNIEDHPIQWNYGEIFITGVDQFSNEIFTLRNIFSVLPHLSDYWVIQPGESRVGLYNATVLPETKTITIVGIPQQDIKEQ